MLRPLIFGNFFRNIQKIKNVLRTLIFQKFLCLLFMQLPLITLLRKELPPEGKPLKEADNFCRILR